MVRSALIVEDDQYLRLLIKSALEGEQFELFEAANGEDAWERVQRLRPSIVMLDLGMPGALDGYEVCQRIKSDPELGPVTKVVVISGRGQASDIQKGYAAGCDAYMVKPFNPITLIEMAAELVPLH